MHERVEARVCGKVQMVMFRDFTCRKARRLHLTGEVRNLPDGSVSVIAEGPRKNLDLLVEHLFKGPLLSKVSSVDVVWLPATHAFTSFSIVYD